MDFYNPILAYDFLQTGINPLQPSEMEKKKKKSPTQNCCSYFYISDSFSSLVGPLFSSNYFCYKSKLNKNKKLV